MKKGLICCLLLSAVSGLVYSRTSLEGKHLIVGSQISSGLFHVNVIRNTSGYIFGLEGVAVKTLALLSQRFHFTYSSLQVNDSSLEKQSDSLPGLSYYLAQGKCDLVIGSVVMTTNRLPDMNFAEGYAYTAIALIIPMPESSDNAAAIIHPFQISVWITVLLSMPIVAIAIYFSIRPMTNWWTLSRGMDRQMDLTPSQAIFEMLRVLLNQGGKFQALKRRAIYFVVGSWCLASFVLVCAYNSVLISYILGSNAEPLVNSIEELADNPKIQLVVDKGYGVDIVLSAAKDGVHKQLGDKIRSNPKSRCVKKQLECVDLVKSGSYVYLQGIFVAINIIDEDFKVTNTCHLAFARKMAPTPGSLAWTLAKKSPYTRDITRGLMEVHQAGLIDFWTRAEVQKNRNANFCLKMADDKLKKKSQIFNNQTRRITLKNFTGAFYVLLAGYLLSFICFIGEILFSFRHKRLPNRLNK